MPWMLWFADHGESVNHGALPVRLECNVNINSGASEWVAQSLPVGWDGMPGVFDLHIIPRYDWRRKCDEGYCSEEEECREPYESHESTRWAANGWFRWLDPERHQNAEFVAGMQSFYGAYYF